MRIIATFIVALAGGGTALRFKVPAGAMIGSMLAVAIFNITTGIASFPQDARVVAQIAAGAFIGVGVQYKDVMDLRHMVKPAALMLSGMLILNMIMAFIMYKLTGIDLVTSLFACAPGGIVDMSLISFDLGADTSKVAILQLIRVISVLSLFPPILKLLSKRYMVKNQCQKDDENNEACAASEQDSSMPVKPKLTSREKRINLALTGAVSLTAGYIGYILGIPAGAMTFSMISVAVVNIVWSRGYMPITIRRITQLFAGALIGERMTFADVIGIKTVLLPAFILIIGFIVMNLCLGFLISKASKLDITTALFATAPGGVSDMALIAEDLGADAPKVAVLQLVRLVAVIALFPIIIKYVTILL